MYLISYLFLSALSVRASFEDIKKRKVSDDIIKCAIFLKLMNVFFGYLYLHEEPLKQLLSLYPAFIMALIFFLISFSFKRLSGHPAFGGGDIKMIFAISLFFDMKADIFIIIMALLLGAASGVLYALFLKSRRMPFAPALSGGLILFLIFRLFN